MSYGCAANKTLLNKEGVADPKVYAAGFTKSRITAGIFDLISYSRFAPNSKMVRIYIEGDGAAWKSRRVLSDDPTPSDPVAFYLAMEDASPSVAYLARPGQYNESHLKTCDPVYWSEKRFAPEVVDAMNAAIDTIKSKSKATDVELVGFSGGAAIAVLTAARRSDVTSLRTVAGNLDTKALCDYHKVSPLAGSLNPIDSAKDIAHIPQRHFVGSKDRIVPYSIAGSFVKAQSDKKADCITVVEDATHTVGWRERWKELLLITTTVCS